MKTLKRFLAVMMTVLLLVSTVSVGMTSTAAKKKVKKIKLNKTSITIYVGETYKLKATVSPSNASNKKVNWSSSNKKVATVSSSGKVTAKKAGTATITVKAKDGSGKKATCKVTVKKVTKVSGIKLNKTSAKLKVGKTVTVKATVSPSNATNKKLKWTSSNKKVATVNSKGKITAKGVGTAKITVKAQDGSGKKATIKVTVSAVKAKSVKLNKTKANMATNATLTLVPTFKPSNTTNKKLTWKSSNKSVATVSSSGVVTALKMGTAKITATTKDGTKKSVTCNITVNSIGATGISLNTSSYTGSPGTSVRLTESITPSNAKKKVVSWKSSNTSVATVDSSGNVSLLKDGTAVITVSTTDGTNKSASCTVTVKTFPVTSVSLSESKVYLTPGGSQPLTAAIYPTNATNKAVAWTSSNSTVATVDSNGTVRAFKAGTAIITATTKDGGKKATCTVTVTKKTTEITVYPSSLSWYIGKTAKLTANIKPEGARQDLIWTSSDTSYATVDANGNVTIKKAPGASGSKKVTITAVAKDGSGVKGSYEIEIKEKVDVTGIKFADGEEGGFTNETVFYVDQVFRPIIIYSPADASEKTSTYTSSNNSVARVQEDGSILMVGVGDATITATSVDGKKKATWDIKVEAPTLKFHNNSVNVETVTDNGSVTLKVESKPLSLASDLGIAVEIADESVLRFVSYKLHNGAYEMKFAIVGSGETEITVSAGKVKSTTPAKVRVTDVQVDTVYEGLKVGDSVNVNPKVMLGNAEVDTVGCITYLGSFEYFEQGWQVNEDGSVTFEIKKDLPADPNECVYIDMEYTYKETSSKTFTKRLYFTPNKLNVPENVDFDDVKAYINSAINSGSNTRDKLVSYTNTKVKSSDLNITFSNLLLESLIKGYMASNGNSYLEEMGLSASDIVNDMFAKSTLEPESDIKPLPLRCDESAVESIKVNNDEHNVTYDIVLELKDQQKVLLDAVESSVYAKVMPVIDKAYVDKYVEEMEKGMGASEKSSVSYGTMHQTYRDGRIVLTINKLTDKVEKIEYDFKADLDFKDATLKTSESVDEFELFEIPLGVIEFTLGASFSTTVEEKLVYYNFG